MNQASSSGRSDQDPAEYEVDAWDLLEDASSSSKSTSVTISADDEDSAWVMCRAERMAETWSTTSHLETDTQESKNSKPAKLETSVNQRGKAKGSARTDGQPHSRAHDATCQLCMERIRGERWMCKDCPAWNLCQMCILLALSDNDVHPGHTIVRVMQPHDVVRLVSTQIVRDSKLYMPAFEPCIHPDETCSICDSSIIGVRYECGVRECRSIGMVFCQDCEARPINAHPPSHPLIKFKKPKKDSVEVNAHVYLESRG
jgi:hypothetical protein